MGIVKGSLIFDVNTVESSHNINTSERVTYFSNRQRFFDDLEAGQEITLAQCS
jgi:hypothetical protein